MSGNGLQAPVLNEEIRGMQEASMDSAYEDMSQTPCASPRPIHSIHPAAVRRRRASFDTASSFNAGRSTASSVSMLVAQQNELMATVNRLAQ